MLANTVENWKEASKTIDFQVEDKKLVSKISFDNGANWQLLSPPAEGDWGCTPQSPIDNSCSLHLFSVTQTRNLGRVFSTGMSAISVLTVKRLHLV